MPATPESATTELAEFITRANVATLPAHVVQRIKLHILDTLGCAIAFAELPWSQQVYRYVAGQGSSEDATIAFYGTKASPALAAFANASLAHGFELDDTDLQTASHPGVVVVPAALAVGERRHSTGAEFLAAVIAGYETMIRVGLGSVGMTLRGFHSTAALGPFGAAAAVASLEGLDVATTAHALGISASLASGIAEYTISGGSVKRLHAGFPSQSGVEAAGLAAAGVTAPRAALEGTRGMLKAFTDTPDPEAVTRGLGDEFRLLGTGFKPYSCCAAQHSVLDAVGDLHLAHGFSPEDVVEIHVRQNPREFDSVGTIRRPADVISSQFSAAFGIALRLTNGSNLPQDYLEADRTDQRLLSIVDKVVYERSETDGAIEGDSPCEVRLTLTDGRVFDVYVPFARGTAQSPLDAQAITDKFRGLVTGIIGEEGANRIIDLVARLEELEDVTELAGALHARVLDPAL